MEPELRIDPSVNSFDPQNNQVLRLEKGKDKDGKPWKLLKAEERSLWNLLSRIFRPGQYNLTTIFSELDKKPDTRASLREKFISYVGAKQEKTSLITKFRNILYPEEPIKIGEKSSTSSSVPEIASVSSTDFSAPFVKLSSLLTKWPSKGQSQYEINRMISQMRPNAKEDFLKIVASQINQDQTKQLRELINKHIAIVSHNRELLSTRAVTDGEKPAESSPLSEAELGQDNSETNTRFQTFLSFGSETQLVEVEKKLTSILDPLKEKLAPIETTLESLKSTKDALQKELNALYLRVPQADVSSEIEQKQKAIKDLEKQLNSCQDQVSPLRLSQILYEKRLEKTRDWLSMRFGSKESRTRIISKICTSEWNAPFAQPWEENKEISYLLKHATDEQLKPLSQKLEEVQKILSENLQKVTDIKLERIKEAKSK